MGVSRNKLIILSVLLLAVFGLVYLTKSKVKIETLDVSIPRSPSLALLYVAESKGFFDDEGLVLTVKNFDTGRDALANVMGGASDLAVAADTPVAHEILSGSNIKIFGSVYNSQSNTQLVVFKDRILGLDDLAGKKIALTKGTSMEFFLASLLRSRGIPQSEVQMVDYNVSDTESLVKEGKVDALVSWPPYVAEVLRENPDKLLSFKSDVYSENGWIVGKSGIAATKPEAIARFFKGLMKAEDYLYQHPRESIAIVTDSIRAENQEDVGNSWDDYTIGLELSNFELKTLDYVVEWMWQSGRYDSARPIVKGYLNPSFLRYVEPESVTVF